MELICQLFRELNVCDCENSSYVQSLMCEMPYLLWSLSVLKHRMKKWRSISRNVECVGFFLAARLPRTTSLTSEETPFWKVFIVLLMASEQSMAVHRLGRKGSCTKLWKVPLTPQPALAATVASTVQLSLSFSFYFPSQMHLRSSSWMDIFFQIFIQSHSSFSAHLLRSLLWEKVCRTASYEWHPVWSGRCVCWSHPFRASCCSGGSELFLLGKQFQQVLLHL